jgi:hypothetical protein
MRKRILLTKRETRQLTKLAQVIELQTLRIQNLLTDATTKTEKPKFTPEGLARISAGQKKALGEIPRHASF